MNAADEYYLRFPSVLKKAIKDYGIDFPKETQWEYSPQTAFRGFTREDGENTELRDEDFLSYAELGKKARGQKHSERDIEWYSCSCYARKAQLEVNLKLPRSKWRISRGIIRNNKGCICINKSTGHIHWWIYENANPSEDFEVINDE